MKKPVKLLTALSVFTAMTAMTAKAVEAEVPVIYGFMLTSDEWRDVEPAEENYGFYSFKADGSTAFTPVSGISPSNTWALDAGVLANGTYYGYSVPVDDTWIRYHLNFTAIKSDEWTVTKSNSFEYRNSDANKVNSDAYLVPSDLAYDAIGDVIYAAARRYQSQLESRLCTVDPATGKLTRLGTIPAMCGLTADATGKLYGIGTDGALYTVSHDGETSTKIGHTGFYPSDGLKQSATFDFKSGKIYWSAMCFASSDDRNYNRNGVYALIEVDPATASSKIVWNYPREQRFSSVSIKNPHPMSPEDIKDLSFEPSSFESLDAKVSFTVPSKTATLAPITGSLTIRCYIDSKLIKTATATAGSKFEVTLPSVGEGEHTLGVEVESNGNIGNRQYMSRYFGKDLPAKIAKVRLTRDESDYTKATISWEAPTVGAHGSQYDASKIRYRVVRYPDEVVVKRSISETSFVDNVDKQYSRIFYAVTPYNVDRPAELGSTTTSNGLMVGSDIVPPYKESFNSKNAFLSYTIIDVDENGDPEVWGTPTWMYDDTYYCAFYYGKRDIPADDWLVTPPIRFEKDRLYKLSYKYYGYYGYGNHFQVALGKEATDESLNRIIQDVERVTYSTDNPGIPTSVLFAPREGERFLGFHHISTTMEHLSIDDIEIVDFGDARIPDYVTGLAAQRISESSSQVLFTAPTLNAAGAKLSGSLTVKIFRNTGDSPVAELSVKPGEAVVWTDNEAVKGKNDYTVYAVNTYGDGLPSYASVDLADSPPMAVTDAMTRYINDRQIEITWTPDETGIGENGNPVDLSEVRYIVYKPIPHEDGTEYRMIGRDLKTPRFIDDDPFAGLTEVQQVLNYYVSAINGTDESIATLTGGVIIGPAYRLPFAESWRLQTQETNPWNKIVNNGAGWYIRHQGYDPLAGCQDEGYGVLTCEVDGTNTQGTGAIMTPRIDLTSMTDPELSFYYYRGPEYDDDIRLMIAMTAEGTSQIKYLPNALLPKSSTSGWEKVTVNLSEYASLQRASVVLVAYVKKDQHVHIDNFRIEGKNTPAIIRPQYIIGESDCRENAPYRFVGAISNFGPVAVTNIKATLKAGDEVVGTTTIASIQPNETAQASFEFVPTTKHVGTTILTLSATNSTDVATKEIEVAPFNPATINDLTGDSRTDDKVTLYWSVPTRTTTPQRVNETFDCYDAFAIDSIGGWTLVDGDGYVPFKFSNGQGGTLEWPNNTKPQSFMVFNPLLIRNAPSANSGINYMVCWGSPSGQNNDWLISPELTGEKQFVSFYARAFMSGREEFHFLISRTDTKPSSFVSLTGSQPKAAPSGWGYYQFIIPEGTRYFAINYVGNRQDGLMIDDLMFEGYHNPIMPEGYNVYRDGRMLNSKPLTERNFVDTDVDTDTQHTYIVRAIYNGKESDDSNAVTLAAASIEGIGSTAADVIVEGRTGSIYVEGAVGQIIEIYRPDGILVNSLTGSDINDIDTPAGLYIVKVGKEAVKVVVR